MNNVVVKPNELYLDFYKKLKSRLYNKSDFTQGEYIDAIDQLREEFQSNPDIDLEELDIIVRKLSMEWSSVSENVKIANLKTKNRNHVIKIAVITGLITGLIFWILSKLRD